ncbi:MAG: DUF2244 domain-containing protein [Rhodobacteraceae bacterium]|nr:DUF2244 domain-containing protein [Paracoccaceae bacterium]
MSPNSPLQPKGFVTFISLTCAFMALPLLAMIGKSALYFLLNFFALTMLGLWFALRHNQRNAAKLHEALCFWPDKWELKHTGTNGKTQHWQANPHWIEITLHPNEGPVEQYLTLRGDGRTIELGAFLSPDERQALALDLNRLLSGLNNYDDVERLLGNQLIRVER